MHSRGHIGSADMSLQLQQSGSVGADQEDNMRYDPHGSAGMQSVTPFYESPAPPTPALDASGNDHSGGKEEKSDMV